MKSCQNTDHVQGAAGMGLLCKAVGARRPAAPQAVPSLSRGQSYSRRVRRTGQLYGSKLPQQVVDQRQGSSGAAVDGTRDKAGDKDE